MIRFLQLLFIIVLSIACEKKPEAVLIFKQWHLPAKADASNIEESKKIPHYQHQKDLYLLLINALEVEGYNTLVSEGCDGEINENFKKTFNGWNYKKLLEKRDESSFIDILTLTPLKVEVKRPETTVICGDSEKLLKENQLAMSDLRGFLGFYLRLHQKSGDEKYLEIVKKALKDLGHGDVADPLAFVHNKVIESWDRVFKYIYERNDKFVSVISKLGTNYPMVVIGGIHAEDLQQKLMAKGIPVRIITPKDYPNQDEELIKKLSGVIEKLKSSK